MKLKKKVAIAIAIFAIGIIALFRLDNSVVSDLEVKQFRSKEDFYSHKIQPIFDNKCIACHSCFNSPCQLNLTSYQGTMRGAHHENIFDFNKAEAKKPTRLYQDASSTKGWQELGFFSVTGSAPKNLLSYMISSPKGVESGLQKKYDSEYSRVCISSTEESELEKFNELNPAGRMPLGLPALESQEITDINLWLKKGAKGPDLVSLEKNIRENKEIKSKIISWEKFFNRSSMQAKLSSRYIYEHLFLASIYFESHPKLFFRLIRSETKTGKIQELATSYPFDKPSKEFYYRLRPITNTIVHKSHIPFPFSEKRKSKWDKDFYQSKWKQVPKQMPAYGAKANNPFATFKSIPTKARYEFFLNNSAYHVMTFIKGPVCRGQTAVNVINDHFWVMFIDPNKDILVNNEKTYDEVTKEIVFPSKIKDEFAPLVDFRDNYWKSVKTKFSRLQENEALSKDWLWSGDKNNSNTTLTIYRHFDSAQIIRGLRGREPKTVWVLDYHVFESIYYNLSAGYNVFGPLLHQVNSRLFMEISRISSEDLFLSFLPKQERQKLRKSWNIPVPKEEESSFKELIDFVTGDAEEKLTKNYIFEGDKIESKISKSKSEFLAELKNNFYTKEQIQSDKENKSEAAYKLEKMPVSGVKLLPDLSLLRMDGKIYSLVHNKDHYNVAMLFFENDRRRREKDSLDVISGVATSYVNLIFDISKKQKESFIKEMLAVTNQKELDQFYDKYALKRSAKNFWQVFNEISKSSDNKLSNETGVLDLNRYHKTLL